MIVVTHNPNIVVHGDAEFVLSLQVAKGQSHIACQGGLQEDKVREEICRVMEGGREAFESRYQRDHASGELGTVIERDELVRRIRLGGDSTLELKRVLVAGSRISAPGRTELADELAAMANGWGGTAVLGVEDKSREALGIRSIGWTRSRPGFAKSATTP